MERKAGNIKRRVGKQAKTGEEVGKRDEEVRVPSEGELTWIEVNWQLE